MEKRIGTLWIQFAAVYLLLGIGLGIHMGKSHDFLLAPVHAHINLLGWATMALMGILHVQFAAQLANKLALAQFWLHQAAMPIMMGALVPVLKGDTSMEPVVGIASTAVGLSVVLFVFNVLRNLRAQS